MKREILIAALALLLLFVNGVSQACYNPPPPCTPYPGSFNLDTPEDDHVYPSTTTSVTLDWDPSSYADYYRVHFGTTSPPPYLLQFMPLLLPNLSLFKPGKRTIGKLRRQTQAVIVLLLTHGAIKQIGISR